jgi:hypothetical protein
MIIVGKPKRFRKEINYLKILGKKRFEEIRKAVDKEKVEFCSQIKKDWKVPSELLGKAR